MLDDLLAHPLLVVTGKGGVGKSTVAAALGLAAARRGLRTIVVEVAARDDVSRALGATGAAAVYADRAVSDGLHHMSVDPQRAMEDYLRRHLPIGAAAPLLSRSRMFATLTAATPGMRELLTIGKVWELARRNGRTASDYELVVLDAPATGHGLALLMAPRTFASVARVGPVASQGRAIASFLADPAKTAVVAVATPEEMPVSETLQLRDDLRREMDLDLSLVVVNAVVRHRFSRADERALRDTGPSAARHAALFTAVWTSHQRSQMARLRRGLPGIPRATLPFVFGPALDAGAIERLSRELKT